MPICLLDRGLIPLRRNIALDKSLRYLSSFSENLLRAAIHVALPELLHIFLPGLLSIYLAFLD